MTAACLSCKALIIGPAVPVADALVPEAQLASWVFFQRAVLKHFLECHPEAVNPLKEVITNMLAWALTAGKVEPVADESAKFAEWVAKGRLDVARVLGLLPEEEAPKVRIN